jgi:hypothetical protein
LLQLLLCFSVTSGRRFENSNLQRLHRFFSCGLVIVFVLTLLARALQSLGGCDALASGLVEANSRAHSVYGQEETAHAG